MRIFFMVVCCLAWAGCERDAPIATGDAGPDVERPDHAPDRSDGRDDTICPPCIPPPSADCTGSGACGCGPYTCGCLESNPPAIVATACTTEGETCGTCPTDRCSFCNLAQCQGGFWGRVESIPDPSCMDGGKGDGGSCGGAVCGPGQYCVNVCDCCGIPDAGPPSGHMECRDTPGDVPCA